MVPVSCPPWPASMTMRLIFRPRARVSERLPSRVGLDAEGAASTAVLELSGFVSEVGAGAGGVFALAVFVAALVELAPIEAVLLSAAALTFASSATAASRASSFSDSGLSATTSVLVDLGAGTGAGATGAGVFCAVATELDFTSITRRYGFASK